jgi:hypothetical protein
MRWFLWFLMAFGWGIQTALLWHGNSSRAALAAGAATLLFAGAGVYFYRRDWQIRRKRHAPKIQPPTL